MKQYEKVLRDRVAELEKSEIDHKAVVKAIRKEKRDIQKYLDAYCLSVDPFLPLEDEKQEQKDKKNANKKGS